MNEAKAVEGLHYFADNADGMSIYQMFVESVHVFDVIADNTAKTPASLVIDGAPDDAMLIPLLVALPGSTAQHPTKGYGVMTTAMGPEGVATHVDGLTIRNYVYPRVATFLTRLYASA